MQLTLHTARPTSQGDSRLGQAMSAWSVKTRHATSRPCTDARVYGHTTTAMHNMSTPPPALTSPLVRGGGASRRHKSKASTRCTSVTISPRTCMPVQHEATYGSLISGLFCFSRSDPPGQVTPLVLCFCRASRLLCFLVWRYARPWVTLRQKKLASPNFECFE